MPILNVTRVFNNLIVLGVLVWIGVMIYSKMDREKLRAMGESLSKMFGGREEK